MANIINIVLDYILIFGIFNFTGLGILGAGIATTISRIGLPSAIEKLIMRFGQLVYGGIIIKIGTEAYAAHNIAGTIETFSYLPGMGFGVAAATLVGQNLGAKKRMKLTKLD